MSEKNLRVIRYITGTLFAAAALTGIPQVVEYWGEPISLIAQSSFPVYGTILMALAMYSGVYPLLAVGIVLHIIPQILRLFSGMKTVSPIICILFLASYIIAIIAVFQRKSSIKYGLISALLFAVASIVSYGLIQLFGTSWNAAVNLLSSQIIRRPATIVLSCFVIQNTPQIQTAKTVNQSPITTQVDSPVEALSKLKELLDSEAITQEDFDEKKRQLLNL